jgi:4'-phosphopantetheinyl transferase
MNDNSPLRKLLPDASIDIWIFDLDWPLNPEVNCGNLLSNDERIRAGSYVFPKDTSRFMLCRAMLRLGLAGYLQLDPQKISLASNCHGKLRLVDHPELHFNVTHSDGLGLIAFTTVGEVGIDAERIQRDVEALEIARVCFTRNESALVAAAQTPREQTSVFLSLWTRKEAVLKAAGFGISHGVDLVDVSQPPMGQVRLFNAPGDLTESWWRVDDLKLVDGFIGAVAAPSGDWTIRNRMVNIEDALHGIGFKNFSDF